MKEHTDSKEPLEPSRRELLKTAAITAAGLVVGTALGDEAEAQKIKHEQIDRETAQKFSVVKEAVALNSKTVLPDGKLLSRGEVLTRLNLNPNTPPEAWLTIVSCKTNASALNFRDAERLVNQGILDKAVLQTIRR